MTLEWIFKVIEVIKSEHQLSIGNHQNTRRVSTVSMDLEFAKDPSRPDNQAEAQAQPFSSAW